MNTLDQLRQDYSKVQRYIRHKAEWENMYYGKSSNEISGPEILKAIGLGFLLTNRHA